MLDLRANTNNTFNTLLMERENKESKKLIIKTFDESGTLLLDDEITISADRNILSGFTTTLERDELMIIGTWSERGSYRAANGIFTVVVDPFQQQQPLYYDFAQFNHFLDYLRQKKVAKIRSKSQAKRALGVIPEFKASVNLIRISESGDGFHAHLEVYNPSSGSNNSRNPGFYYPYGMSPWYNPYSLNPYYNRYNYQPYSPAGNNVDYNRALHAFVVDFNDQGKWIKDYGLKLQDVKMTSTDQVTDFLVNENGAAVVYKKEKYVHQGIFDGTGALLKEDTLSFNLNVPSETTRNEAETNTGVRFWYGNNFLSWGYQNVIDISKKGEDRNRYVFYIHRISKK